MTFNPSKFWRAAVVALTVTLVAVAPADARRGGSFGSRGARTYSAPRSTSLSPGYVAPVQRSMTARPASAAHAAPTAGSGFQAPRSGFGGGLLGGLVAGGLIGGMMGHGWGGGGGGGWGGGGFGGGGFASLIQLLLLGGLIWWGISMFRRRSANLATTRTGFAPAAPFGIAPGPQPVITPTAMEFPVSPADEAAFGQLLVQVQDAFGREDFARLREVTTPEVMSYLAEELSENSVKGVRNEVTGARLLQAEISESWREGDTDYVTAALRYESIDVMRNRTSGDVVSGDPTHPTEARELWTFVRQNGSPWKLSAIQET